MRERFREDLVIRDSRDVGASDAIVPAASDGATARSTDAVDASRVPPITPKNARRLSSVSEDGNGAVGARPRASAAEARRVTAVA
jgi:hypothetical protein